MKKLISIFGSLVLIIATTACEGSDSMTRGEDPQQGQSLSFTEYLSQTRPSTYWAHTTDYGTDWDARGVIVVNSANELEQYKNSDYTGDYPPINFSEQTLLYAYGYSSALANMKINRFDLLSGNQYRLSIELTTGLSASMEPWVITLLTDKLSNDCEIELNVQNKEVPLEP